MNSRLVLVALATLFALVATAGDCPLLRKKPSKIKVTCDDSGCSVRAMPARKYSSSHRGLSSVGLSFDDLMEIFEERVFFLMSDVRTAQWQSGLGRGPTRALAYKAFLQSVGLDMR